MYSEKLLYYFNNPKHAGSLKHRDAVGQAGIPGQGNFMVIELRIQGDRIVDAGFQTYGCPAAIACGSWLSEQLIGHTVQTALAITSDQIANELGGLSLGKEHCATLAIAALHDAIERNGQQAR